ncbi:MAG: hypothetical protein HWN67_02710 [Candidatus Helarchaeota archaeon]|nr:hypothetical protein [Candidatus Helarchaeota archaeon]
MSEKKKKESSEEEGEEELQKRLKKEEELFEDLFGVSIEEASEKDIEDTLEDLEKIEKDMEITQKKEAPISTPQKIEELEVKPKLEAPVKPIKIKAKKVISDEITPMPKPSSMAPLPDIAHITPPPKPLKIGHARLLVKREFDYIGGDVRFKVVVDNTSDKLISDINVVINPTTQFSTEERVKSLNFLKPGESRGIDFILTPLDCGKSSLYGTVSYIDFQGQPCSATIEPKEIQIKCPLVQPERIAREKIENLKVKLQKSSWAIEFLLSAKQAYKIIREQISALDVTEIFNDPEKFLSEWSGLAKVTEQELIISAFIRENKINIEVYSEDIKQSTGLLAYIKNNIKLAIESAQKIGGTVEQIGFKILDSFDLCKKSIQLATLCEIKPLISDIIAFLKDIQPKMQKSVPDSNMSQRIELWINTLSKKFDVEQIIDKRLASALEYEIIQWLKESKSIIQTNAKIYQDSFSEYAKLGSIQEGLNALYRDIDEIEQKYSMRILRYLLVVQKHTGVTFYRGKLGSDEELDPFLVSGFLSAISSFGTELSLDKKETMMKKLTYEDFEINLEDGEYIRAALLSHGKGTEFLSDKLKQFVGQFEEKFITEIINWSGKMSVFNQASEILLNIMPVIKIYPPTEKELTSTLQPPKTELEEPKLEEKLAEDTPGTLKVVSFPSKAETTITPKKIQVITPKPLFTAPKIQAEEEIGELSELRCSICGARISKKDLQKINMGFIIPCKDCGGDLIGEAIKKD